jgi:Clostripain family
MGSLKSPPPEGIWTILVYIAADNELAESAKKSLGNIEQGGSSKEVRTVVQIDGRKGAGATRYIGENGHFHQIQKKENVDTGDPQQLIDFLKWGMSQCPATNYLCVLWGHGAGLDQRTRGFAPGGDSGKCLGASGVDSHVPANTDGWYNLYNEGLEEILHDYTTGHYLSNACLRFALDEVRRSTGRILDILGLDACLMGMTEIVCDFRDSVHFAITSEDTEPRASWPYKEILSELVSNPNRSPEELGTAIVSKYMKSFPIREQKRGLTLSLCDLHQSPPLIDAVKSLSLSLSEWVKANGRIAIENARSLATRFDRDYVDLEEFCQALSGEQVSAALIESCQAVISAVENGFVVFSESKGRNIRRARGISIFFPQTENSKLKKSARSDVRSNKSNSSGNRVAAVPKSVILIRSSYKDLSFVLETGWDKFLLTYLGFDSMPGDHNSQAGGTMSVDESTIGDGRKKPTGPRKKPHGAGKRKKPTGPRKKPTGPRKKPKQ